MLTPQELRERLVRSGIARAEELLPCTAEDIDRLEREAGQPLPGAYVDFLLTIGRGAGEFMSDLTIFYPDIIKAQNFMRELLAEANLQLPDDAWILCDRYGEVMLFVHLSDGDDPPVYRWYDSDEFELIRPSIWEWVQEELDAQEGLLGG